MPKSHVLIIATHAMLREAVNSIFVENYFCNVCGEQCGEKLRIWVCCAPKAKHFDVTQSS